ncbi:hypothetical protein Bbelb_108560 [Branchiostoma belcheri]|nr:hypothetical protein Bbelb_108560 [Branchiostoma belcheri]
MEAAGCAEPCKRIDRDLRFSICMIVVGMSLLTAGSLMVILGHVLSAQLDSENANSLAIAGPVSLTISGGFVLPGLCLYFVRKRKSARRLRRIPRSGTELVDLVFSSYPSLSDISPSRNYAPPPSYQEVMQMGLSVYPLSSNSFCEHIKPSLRAAVSIMPYPRISEAVVLPIVQGQVAQSL